MTALTQAFEPGRTDGKIVSYPVAAGVTIYKGSLLVTRGDGYAYPLRSPAASQPDVFIGIADETVNNSTGVAGALQIHVMKSGVFTLAYSGAVQATVGTAVYGADSGTGSSTTTNAVLVGYAVQLTTSAYIRLRIDRAVQ
jgi:hypothetical protein